MGLVVKLTFEFFLDNKHRTNTPNVTLQYCKLSFPDFFSPLGIYLLWHLAQNPVSRFPHL